MGGWWGGGGQQRKQKQKTPPEDVRPTVLSKRFALNDLKRNGERLVLAPCGRFALATDGLARVALIEIFSGRTIRIWKGYRDAECGWIQSNGTMDGRKVSVLYCIPSNSCPGQLFHILIFSKKIWQKIFEKNFQANYSRDYGTQFFMRQEEEFWKFGLRCKAEKSPDLMWIVPGAYCNCRIAFWAQIVNERLRIAIVFLSAPSWNF